MDQCISSCSQSSSCIDLIFTDQPQLVPDCVIHASLYPNCFIIYCKLNLKITCPATYTCVIWGYKKASSVCIKKVLRTVNWDVLFHLKRVHEQANVFNVIINIFLNFVPNKIIKIHNEDHLQWITLLTAKLNKIINHLSYTKIID